MKKELKINKVKEVINRLQAQHEKITKVKVAELTGYHRNFITENWNTILDEKENVQNVQKESVQIPNSVQNIVSLKSKNVQIKEDISFKPVKPSKDYSTEYNRFLLRCIKDPNISFAIITKNELKRWEIA